MNTDACNVEDINIHHITEWLSLSFVTSFEDWYCLFRTWSFTLCKNDLDPHDNSDSASVCKNSSYRFQQWICPCAVRIQQVALFYLPSIHQISTLEKTKFNQHSILSSLMSKRLQRVAPFYDAAQFASSEKIDFHVWFSRGFLMQ